MLTFRATIRINVIVSGRILLLKVPKRPSMQICIRHYAENARGYVNPAEIHLSQRAASHCVTIISGQQRALNYFEYHYN